MRNCIRGIQPRFGHDLDPGQLPHPCADFRQGRADLSAIAYDGAEAVEAARGHAPEAILLDIGLPKMNGYDVCRAIRAQSGGEAIRIIALSGWGQEADRKKSAEAGFDVHLVKPVEMADIERALGRAAVTRA